MTPHEPPATTANAPPDWATLPDDVLCPLCNYNLRGLTQPLCPECGYAFTWPALFEARRTAHPYLFEHHPHHNARSFRETFLHGLRPRRFWTTLAPAHTVRPRRLLGYYGIVTAIFLLVAAAALAMPFIDGVTIYRWERAKFFSELTSNPPRIEIPRWTTPQQIINQSYPPLYTWRGVERLLWSVNRSIPAVLFFFLAYPAATWLTLMIFQQSMRRARIRPVQVLRCVIYSADASILTLLLAIAWALYPPNRARFMRLDLAWIELALCVLAGYRLAAAYRYYLRFSHARATVITSQVIVVLAGFAVYVRWVGWM